MDEENKENEVVVCISNLDMKIDESNIFTANLNQKANKNENNFLTNLNSKHDNKIENEDSSNYNFTNTNTEKSYLDANKNLNLNQNSNSNNHFLENTFEQIKFNLNKLKSQRDKVNLCANNSNNTLNNLTENSFKSSKLEIENSSSINYNTNRSKSMFSARFNKVLDSNNVETEYLETEENDLLKNRNRKNVLFVIVFVLVFLSLLGLLFYFLLKK